MTGLSDLRALCQDYIHTVEELERKRKPGEGVFGLKGGPKDDPCHGRFAAELEALLGAYEGDVREALAYLWFLPGEHREPRSVYWMLTAVHGLALSLIARLAPEDAAELRGRYAEAYPRWERLPVQRRTLEALKKRQRE